MNSPSQFFASDIPASGDSLVVSFFILCAFIFVSGSVVFSIVHRIRKRKPIFRAKLPNTRFSEQWRSGRSLKISRWGGAASCLWITVTNEELIVCPHFPFNVGFMPERFDVEHRIRGKDILSVELQSLRFWGERVLVRYRKPDEKTEGFEFTVRDVGAFIQAIEEIRNGDQAVQSSLRR